MSLLFYYMGGVYSCLAGAEQGALSGWLFQRKTIQKAGEQQMARKMTAAQVNKALKGYSKEELEELIVQMYKSSPETSNFLNVRLGGGQYAEDLLQESKGSLDKVFFPGRRTKPFSMQDAKAVVDDFRNVCLDPEKCLSLELYFTKRAVEFAERHEVSSGSFYTITESMLRSAVNRINRESESFYESAKDRLEALRASLPGTGLKSLLEPVLQEIMWTVKEEEPEEQTEPASAGKAYTSEIGATLPEEDGDLFFELWWPVMNYINKKKQVIKGKVIKAGLPADELKGLANALWNNIGLIDEYLKDEGKTLPEDHQNIIRGWKRAISGRFILERHLKNGSILISSDNNCVYQVRGIKSSFDEMFFGWHLPVIMDATLIPFRNVIICDGLLIPLRIYVGSGIAKSLKESYMTAKRQREIRTAL